MLHIHHDNIIHVHVLIHMHVRLMIHNVFMNTQRVVYPREAIESCSRTYYAYRIRILQYNNTRTVF